MEHISLEISKRGVLEEVSKTTAYSGAKMEEDATAYDRIFTTDEDAQLLERFWVESKNMVVGNLKKLLEREREEGDVFRLSLQLSSSFDSNLQESMERSLFSFFVLSIVSKWYTFTNKKEASSYAQEATIHMDDVLRKAFYKKKPTRPRYV